MSLTFLLNDAARQFIVLQTETTSPTAATPWLLHLAERYSRDGAKQLSRLAFYSLDSSQMTGIMISDIPVHRRELVAQPDIH